MATVRQEVDPRKIAAFIVAGIEGSFGMAKNARSLGLLRSNLEVLAQFLESLRPRGGTEQGEATRDR